jgi:hypothetical protein
MPAQAGTQLTSLSGFKVRWFPAFAGMTNSVIHRRVDDLVVASYLLPDFSACLSK